MNKHIWQIVVGLLYLATGNPAAAQHQENVGFITLCGGLCSSFASMDVGRVLVGNIVIDVAPSGAWDATDVVDVQLEFFDQWSPEVPFDGTNAATANPLPFSAAAGAAAGGYTTSGTSDAFGLVEGTLLIELTSAPFSDNDAWLIFEMDEFGNYTAQLCLFFTSAGCIPGATQAIKLEGSLRFVTQYPIEVAPASVDFGVVAIGDSQQIEVTFTNNGLFAFHFNLISFTFPLAPFAQIPQVDTCSLQSVYPRESCSVTIAFEPTAVGRFESSFRLVPGFSSTPVQEFVIPIVGDASDPDTDGDGRPDSADNCILHANPNQKDTDTDGYGNRCDADLNNDCVVNPLDLGIFKSVFFSADADADLNVDGIVNTVDLGIFKSLFFLPPGPSSETTACDP